MVTVPFRVISLTAQVNKLVHGNHGLHEISWFAIAVRVSARERGVFDEKFL